VEIAVAARRDGTRILIVEDERIVAMDLAGTLNELGYSVVGMAARGEEAIARADELRPHLILMDVRLGNGLDGIQVAEVIRRSRDVPVIYLTAHSDDETLHRAARTEASGYLVKPFTSPELHCAIEIALHKHVVDARLRESEQWLATTLRSIAEAVIATDASGRIRLFNPGAEALTGWSHQEAVEHTIYEVLSLRDEQTGLPIADPVQKALDSSDAPVVQGSLLMSRSGELLAVEECAAPIVDSFGRLLGRVLVLRDITERRRQSAEIQKLNQELEQRVVERTAALEAANRDMEAFSYSVAHDLRAPLRGIDGFSQLLIESQASRLNAQGIGYLNRVRSATARMGDLIDALLSLARIGRTDMQRVQVDFSALVQSLVPEIVAAHPDHEVDVRVQEGIYAYADAQLLRIALYNLLDNAWKFTRRSRNPQVVAGAELRDGVMTYFIRDNGAGFEPLHAGKMFEAFERLHRDKEFSGTGIGLAIVQRVVQRHGGKIWADSQPGEGATFLFTLPRQTH
jgi:PAS domain S-box-containing protein